MSKRRILVVDDESLITESLSKALLRWDYDVTSALESKQAVERLSRDRYDLVLTDVRMPGIGGMELLQRVKEVSPKYRRRDDYGVWYHRAGSHRHEKWGL